MVTWITAAENSTTRGWTGGLSRTESGGIWGSVHRIVVVVVILFMEEILRAPVEVGS